MVVHKTHKINVSGTLQITYYIILLEYFNKVAQVSNG